MIEKAGIRCILADDPGLGKTIQAAGVMHRNPHALPAVVVSPIKGTWQQELQRFPSLHSVVLDGRKPHELHPGDRTVYLINYDILRNWVPKLKRCVRSVWLDESQWISEMTQRTQAAISLCDSVPHCVAMSGTPISNRVVDLWPTLRCVWPAAFPSFDQFADRYSYWEVTRFGKKFFGAQHAAELHGILRGLGMVRRLKSVLNLPPKKTTVQVYHMDAQQRSTYYNMRDNFNAWAIAGGRASRVGQGGSTTPTASVGDLLRAAVSFKLPWVVDSVNAFLRDNPAKKLVLFGIHLEPMDALIASLRAAGHGVACIRGDVSERERVSEVQRFQVGDARVFIGNIKSAGTGITLTAASDLWFYELWWNPSAHNQAADRIYRIGQTQPVDIRWLVAAGTLEDRLCSLLTERMNISGGIIDGIDSRYSQRSEKDLGWLLQKEVSPVPGFAL